MTRVITSELLYGTLNYQFVGEVRNELDLHVWFLGIEVCGKQTAEFGRLKLIEQ